MTRPCPDCDGVNRRDFMKATGAGLAAAAATPLITSPVAQAAKSSSAKATSETVVAQLYKTLSDQQKKLCAFGFDHELRQEVDNNWHITKSRVGRDFSADQQAMIQDIFMGLHSDEYADKVRNSSQGGVAIRPGAAFSSVPSTSIGISVRFFVFKKSRSGKMMRFFFSKKASISCLI